MARQRQSRIKPSYKWCRFASVPSGIETHASTAVSEVHLLCPSLNITDGNLDVLFERLLLSFALRRQTVSGTVQNIAYFVAMQKTDSTTGFPTEVLNPLSTDADHLANRNILAWGQLPVPATNTAFDGVTDVASTRLNSEVHLVDVKVRRRLMRSTDAICLTLVADDSLTVEQRIQASVLLRQN